MLELLTPKWAAPANVRAVIVTRNGGSSEPPWDSCNLGLNSGDEPAKVRSNREQLREQLGLRREPLWLNQVHGTTVVQADQCLHSVTADASWTSVPEVACTALMADCLPILLCDHLSSGTSTRVAAAHAGWRGLSSGIVRNTVAALDIEPSQLLVHIGPGIGVEHFQIGAEVREAFFEQALSDTHRAAMEECFHRRRDGLYADLQGLAHAELEAIGVRDISRSPWCTYSHPQTFYSYRRDGMTGRNAALIWLEPGA